MMRLAVCMACNVPMGCAVLVTCLLSAAQAACACRPLARIHLKSDWNSPDSCASHKTSQPPINSPPLYTWGMVGQLENFLMPSLNSLSSSTLRDSKLMPALAATSQVAARTRLLQHCRAPGPCQMQAALLNDCQRHTELMIGVTGIVLSHTGRSGVCARTIASQQGNDPCTEATHWLVWVPLHILFS